MKLIAVLSLICTAGLAGESERPVCNAKTRGQFWPAEANGSRDATRALAQQGGLQMCTFGTWKYKWKPMSVNVRDLAREKRMPYATR
jgi:hypothetical protein